MTIVTLVRLNTESRLLIGPAHKQDHFPSDGNGFEYLLASLGITQKNGHPGHPQTQGKIERFQQTLKRWLAAQPAAATVAEL